MYECERVLDATADTCLLLNLFVFMGSSLTASSVPKYIHADSDSNVNCLSKASSCSAKKKKKI